jgi:hypothetical protein
MPKPAASPAPRPLAGLAVALAAVPMRCARCAFRNDLNELGTAMRHMLYGDEP